jgi:hypothetical protein
MVGTINLALTQQLDEFGEPLSGGLLYFIQAGTISTPQNAFQDSALTIPWPNPIPLDAAGRIPMFYLADGQIKVRLQSSMGVVKFTADNLMVIGPSAGGGGGGSVDATTVLQTGDIKIRYDNAVINGFVRCNGLTIGPAGSGATELASSTAQNLFQFLWNVDSTLAVTPGGRGASAAADWAAGSKAIALPDTRSALLGAVDGMGTTNKNNWQNVVFSKGNATTLGSIGGRTNTNVALVTGNLPAINYTPTGTVGVTLNNNTNIWRSGSTVGLPGGVGTAYDAVTVGVQSTSFSGTPASLGGSSTAFNVCPPIMLITIYLKL